MRRKSIKRDEFDAMRDRLGDLSAAFGPAWNECFLNETGLSLPGWRRPFSPAELRSTFFRMQLIRVLEHDLARLKRERQAAWDALEASEARCRWYRSQLTLESRYGAMLQRMTA